MPLPLAAIGAFAGRALVSRGIGGTATRMGAGALLGRGGGGGGQPEQPGPPSAADQARNISPYQFGPRY